MQLVTTASHYDTLYQQWITQAETRPTIALVPTMGALHEGHQALIRDARQRADIVVVSIFVNPLQFGPQEDLSRYPRPLENDLTVCRSLGVDAVFHPDVATLYPQGMDTVTTVVPPASLTERYCGAFRPGHFVGVATVVLKLFQLIHPTIAVFGEKDAQQLAVIRKMVADFHLPIEIIGHPTVRNADGLALSSRNQYLQTEPERHAALALSQILKQAREAVQAASHPLPATETLESIRNAVMEDIENGGVTVQVQYLEAVDRHSFAPVAELTRDSRVLIAAYVNAVRLIDNMDMA